MSLRGLNGREIMLVVLAIVLLALFFLVNMVYIETCFKNSRFLIEEEHIG